jgi:hypothetical protein
VVEACFFTSLPIVIEPRVERLVSRPSALLCFARCCCSVPSFFLLILLCLSIFQFFYHAESLFPVVFFCSVPSSSLDYDKFHQAKFFMIKLFIEKFIRIIVLSQKFVYFPKAQTKQKRKTSYTLHTIHTHFIDRNAYILSLFLLELKSRTAFLHIHLSFLALFLALLMRPIERMNIYRERKIVRSNNDRFEGLSLFYENVLPGVINSSLTKQNRGSLSSDLFQTYNRF